MKNKLFLLVSILLFLTLIGTAAFCNSCGIIPAAESASPDTTVIESEDTSVKYAEGTEKTKEELIVEEEKLKQEQLEKDKKEKGLTTDVQTNQETYMQADDIKPEGNCGLIIITPLEFVSGLIPLKAHKNNTGIITKIISLEDIYSSYEGRDEAEKVKYCLADYKKGSDIKYAMLVGDSDKFPIRFTKTDRETAAAHDTAFYGTDLYYADLYKSDGNFDDWDNNKNGYFGELAGESGTGPLNVDKVDLTPDIAVGRIPASNIDEVNVFVAKVMDYELNAAKSDYTDNVLLISTQDPSLSALFCADQEKVAAELLKNKNVTKLFDLDKEFFNVEFTDENSKIEYAKSCEEKYLNNGKTINGYLNSGTGLVSYMGHGDKSVWWNIYDIDFIPLSNNAGKLPIIFAGGCGTAEFATLPPYSGYTDINGIYQKGTNNGQVFTQTPPQPACIQQEYNPESMAEAFTVYYNVGAVGYLGFITGAQGGFNSTLNYSFFEAIKKGMPTLGEVWSYMTENYYEVRSFPETIDTPDWVQVAGFHQPWKLFLFGDPSLRINGIKQ